MHKKLTAKDVQLLDTLSKRMFLTIDFIESVEELPMGDQLRALVREAVDNRDTRSMKLLDREIRELTIGLTIHEREGLEAILLQRLGVNVDEERATLKQTVARIIKRGLIVSEKERQHLNSYLEMLEANEGDVTEIAAIRKLL